MRNIHYKSKSFRLSDQVLEEIEQRKGDKSYNQLFEELLNIKEEKYGL